MSRNLSDLDPRLEPLARQFLERAQAAGLSVVVTQTRRTMEEQAALYAQGRTRPGKVVTNAKPGQSAHNAGLAFDVAFLAPGGLVTWEGPWERLGEIGRSLGLEWGGDWPNFSDRPHFQFPNWREHIPKEPARPTLRRGSRGPAVRELRRRLYNLSFLWNWGGPDTFGPQTEEAVKRFQMAEGLEPDGIVGPKTWAALDRELDKSTNEPRTT